MQKISTKRFYPAFTFYLPALNTSHFIIIERYIKNIATRMIMSRACLLKYYIFLVAFTSLYINAFAQLSNERNLFVIDSIPLLNNPENWNQLLEDEVADISVIRNKDTLKLLALENMDAVTYIFTKEYRNRPDSIKKIPGLKKLEMKNDVWTLNGLPYTGKYIDYYNSGRRQDEGTLLNGKLNGELIVYFPDGKVKSKADYINGTADGISIDYYKNGSIMQSREFKAGRPGNAFKLYFINGQIQGERKSGHGTAYDTAVSYYSTGKVKQVKLIRNGMVVADKKADAVNYYTEKFNQSIRTGDIKEANKYYFKMWNSDSTGADAYFKHGLLLLNEFRFDKAIAEFDKALEIEPLMRESLVHRAIARIKKYRFPNPKELSKYSRTALLELKDFVAIPTEEQAKVCRDIQEAEQVDFSVFYITNLIPPPIVNHCLQNRSK